jgi:type IV pilus assembly protein PilY1
MKRTVLPIILLIFPILSGFLTGPDRVHAASMVDYCQVPPYVIQNVPPNVMIILDTSRSMLYFAYRDDMGTPDNVLDDNFCTNSSDPCANFDPAITYYGYFDTGTWYTYSNNRFLPRALKSAGAKQASDWDGNFLNWLTMRRIDVVRKVLTGGRAVSGEGSGFSRLRGEAPGDAAAGLYKRVENAGNYIGASASGPRDFHFATGDGGEVATFTVKQGGTTEGTFSVALRVPNPVEGVLQSVVGTRARLGLTFYKEDDQGGNVRVYIGGGSLPSTVNQINLSRPSSNTPLAETLWTVAGYYAQQASIASIGDPGPRYSGGDYEINNNVDPFNFGTGGQPRFPYCGKAFVLLLTDGDPCADGNLPAALADYADGISPYNCSGNTCAAAPRTVDGVDSPFEETTIEDFLCPAGGNVGGLEDVALWARTTDLRNLGGTPNVGKDNLPGIQNLSLFVISAFHKGSNLLRYAAINGGFEDADGDMAPWWQYEWDKTGDGEPDNFHEADDGASLESALRDALSTILKRASSGTAASVLASGEGSGANLVQAVFYPRRLFSNDIINWTGVLQNLWYYVDPFFTNSNIREDGPFPPSGTPDRILDLSQDTIVQLYFDTTLEATRAARFVDSDGDGDADYAADPAVVPFEKLSHLWEAGSLLWERNLTAKPRRLYTATDGGMIPFSTGNVSTLRPYLQASDDDEARAFIDYVHGVDNVINPSRNRTVFDDFGDGPHVWKLGDIVNSTPRIASWIPLNLYDKVYNDDTYAAFVNTADYKSRGTVFTGGNDGMLHAFKLGRLELKWTGQTAVQKARLVNDNTAVPLGEEIWSYIPKNVLPYLRYQLDPDYCHIYGVDLTPFVFDASIGGSDDGPGTTRAANSWRTVVIGGMRTGGACRDLGDSCSDCVNSPVSGLGYSAYFALDVTDPDNPQLLWEFTSPQLGFATTGPAVVRIHSRDNAGAIETTTNGHWFVVFGSGPTGPVDTTYMQFLGRSDQNLRLFVVDLKTGQLERTIDTGIPYAFAGSMLNATADPDKDYQDDAVYIGYTKRTGSPGTWTSGGVGRLLTKESPDPNAWAFSTVLDGIGPVTAAVTRLQDKTYSNMWLYFGTGRYFYVQDTVTDDATGQRKVFGIKEPCYTVNVLNPNCTDAVDPALLTDVSNIADVPTENTANSTGFKGWYIDLDPSSTIGTASTYYAYPPDNVARPYRAERVITDPLATSTGLAFFTTYKPYAEECALGGKSFIWAVRYNTGGVGGSLLRGKALVQVSTASVEQIDLSTAFQGGAGSRGGRRSGAMEGVPPTAQGLSLMTPPPPVRRVIHFKER